MLIQVKEHIQGQIQALACLLFCPGPQPLHDILVEHLPSFSPPFPLLRLIPAALSSHWLCFCPYTVHTLLIHCQYTVHTLSIHCSYTVHTLSTHCPQTAHTLFIHCPYTFHKVSIHCVCTVHTLEQTSHCEHV